MRIAERLERGCVKCGRSGKRHEFGMSSFMTVEWHDFDSVELEHVPKNVVESEHLRCRCARCGHTESLECEDGLD